LTHALLVPVSPGGTVALTTWIIMVPAGAILGTATRMSGARALEWVPSLVLMVEYY
jgi:hypothetical protein